MSTPPDEQGTLAGQTTAQAERAVIGSALLDARVIDEVVDVMAAEDMASPAHETIWRAVLALHGRGIAPDAISVADELGADLARIGGPVYLHQAVSTVTVASSASWHAQIVHREAIRRRVALASLRMRQDAETLEDPLDAINAARATLDALADGGSDEAATDVWSALDLLEQGPGDPTPWPCLTRTLAGWRPGGLYIVAARPAVGKTVVAQAIALDMARRGRRAVLVTLEMSREEMYLRILSAVGSVDMGRIQRRSLRDGDHEALAQAAAHVDALPLTIIDRSSLTVAQIGAAVRRLQRQGEVGVLVIDYLALIQPADRRRDRREQVDEISRSLKVLARSLDVPVVAMGQLNRGAAGERPPVLSDLRESGGQEQDADVVVLLHRDISDSTRSTDLHVWVAKNRHGPTDRHALTFLGQYSRAEDQTTPTTT